MLYFDQHFLKESVAEELRKRSRRGIFYGFMDGPGSRYLESCKAFHETTGSLLIFTRDSGHHSSGWFKNPQYERCLHLSISLRAPSDIAVSRPFDRKLSDEWCDVFFGEKKRLIWEESSKSREAVQLEVRHYRVFCNSQWEPILPQGEVYSTDFTEKGWRSWSELHPEESRKEPSILHAG